MKEHFSRVFGIRMTKETRDNRDLKPSHKWQGINVFLFHYCNYSEDRTRYKFKFVTNIHACFSNKLFLFRYGNHGADCTRYQLKFVIYILGEEKAHKCLPSEALLKLINGIVMQLFRLTHVVIPHDSKGNW